MDKTWTGHLHRKNLDKYFFLSNFFSLTIKNLLPSISEPVKVSSALFMDGLSLFYSILSLLNVWQSNKSWMLFQYMQQKIIDAGLADIL